MRRWAAVVMTVVLSLLVSAARAQQPQTRETGRKVVTSVVPTYPEIARRMQLQGVVKIQALVLPNGKVKSTMVVGGSPVLAKAAVDAVEKWRWQEAPQESKELIELRFNPYK
jgi:TonB family protein